MDIRNGLNVMGIAGGSEIEISRQDGDRWSHVQLSIEDVLALAYYALTTFDLTPEDPRHAFVEAVRRLYVGEGWNKGGQRLTGGADDPRYTPMADADRTAKPVGNVQALILVTDKGAQLIGPHSEDDDTRRAIVDACTQAMLYAGASVVQLRRVEFLVPLPSAPAVTQVDAGSSGVQLEVPAEALAAVDEERRRQGAVDVDRAWSLLPRVLEPGLYRVTRSPTSVGITRVEEPR